MKNFRDTLKKVVLKAINSYRVSNKTIAYYDNYALQHFLEFYNIRKIGGDL